MPVVKEKKKRIESFRLPFNMLPMPLIRGLSNSRIMRAFSQSLKPLFPYLELNLKQAEMETSPREYIACSVTSVMVFFLWFSFIGMLAASKTNKNIFMAPLVLLFVTLFIFSQQMTYPHIRASRRVKDLERNLLPALQDMLIQLRSGVPVFDILVNISKSNYGEVSKEFGIAVKRINAGVSQITALEDLSTENPSLFFRRSVWQLVNGMKAGSDMSSVIQESINSLSEQQLIQISNYGAQLNPLAMFYMLVVIIMPALSTTFIIILSSLISLPGVATKMGFYGLFTLVFLFQIIFLGLIKTKRPSLLG